MIDGGVAPLGSKSYGPNVENTLFNWAFTSISKIKRVRDIININLNKIRKNFKQILSSIVN